MIKPEEIQQISSMAGAASIAMFENFDTILVEASKGNVIGWLLISNKFRESTNFELLKAVFNGIEVDTKP